MHVGDYRTRSLPRHMTSRHDNVAYSSADEDFKPSPRLRSREQSGTVSHGNRGSNGGRSKRLAALYWSHDRVLSRSHDSLVGSCDQDDEVFDKALKLPEVVKTSACKSMYMYITCNILHACTCTITCMSLWISFSLQLLAQKC